MKAIKLHIIICCLVFVHTAFTQTIALPDNNLRDKLIASYPSVMQGNELDIAQAAAMTGALDLRNSNISNAEGIQYFTSITTLSLSGNNLTTLPDISGITGLTNFYATGNNLTSLPDFSGFTQLSDFQVMDNELTSLPGLENCSNLLSIYCSDNNLSSFPPLESFPLLRKLVIGENPFNQVFNYALCPDLEELHIHKINTDTIIGLDQLTKLKVLFAWENSIRDISGLENNTTLQHCVIFDNPIEDLPTIANKPSLNGIDANNCNLTFEDIQQVIDDGPLNYFSYENQNTINYNDISTRANNPLSLDYPIDTPLNTNVYVWRKDGGVVDSSTTSTLTFSPITLADSGNYVLTIYNTDITDLVLHTDTFHVTVDVCIEFELPYIDMYDKDCVDGYTIDLTNAQIQGGTPPFEYEFVNSVYDETFDEVVIEGIAAGKYELIIKDAKNCTASQEIILDKIDGCTPVITPNGDGVADSYFLEHAGIVKIYDLKRYLVNTIEAPASWDGVDKNGALLDAGYYILIQEGQPTVFITILR